MPGRQCQRSTRLRVASTGHARATHRRNQHWAFDVDSHMGVWQQSAAEELLRDQNNTSGDGTNIDAMRWRSVDLLLRVRSAATREAFVELVVHEAILSTPHPAVPLAPGRSCGPN